MGHFLMDVSWGDIQDVELIANHWSVPSSFFIADVLFINMTKRGIGNVLCLGGHPLFLTFHYSWSKCRVASLWWRWSLYFDLDSNLWSSFKLLDSESDWFRNWQAFYMDELMRTREQLTYVQLLVEIDIQAERVLEVPIALLTRAQIELKITYKVTLDFYETCNQIGQKQGE